MNRCSDEKVEADAGDDVPLWSEGGPVAVKMQPGVPERVERLAESQPGWRATDAKTGEGQEDRDAEKLIESIQTPRPDVSAKKT